MGGNATRYYIGQTQEFRRTDNYFFGDLRRIITVGTPHKGAAIAAYVWQYPNGEPRIENDLVRVGARGLGQGDLLAYRDLTPGSETLRSFETIRETDPARLRGPGVHTIIVYADDAPASQETLLWGFYPLGARLLEADLSDRIVCVQSQRGAILDAGAFSELHRLTHTQEAGSRGLFLRVLELLNQAEGPGVSRFDMSGMPPSRAVPDVPRGFTCVQP
jgi:hypothetical protein